MSSKVNKLTIIEGSEFSKSRKGGGSRKWARYRCECGNETEASCIRVKRGDIRSCGCLRSSFEPKLDRPLVIQGYLTEIEGTRAIKNQRLHADFSCECGNVVNKQIASLVYAKQKCCSAGCSARALKSKEPVVKIPVRTVREGKGCALYFGNRVHQWSKAVRGRCEDKNRDNYDRYGGVGVEFRFASTFDLADYCTDLAIESGFNTIDEALDAQLSLDRIDSGGHYEPGNLRWADIKQQTLNRRSRKKS